MNRPLPRWPLYLIASPAAVAVWSGWVGLGTLCGFGMVHPLPGIADGFQINTAITLPVGVEAYGAYALRAWLTPGVVESARKFARWSAIGSLALGMLGQVVYHLLSAAHAIRAPWPVVVLVSCLPVVDTRVRRCADSPAARGRRHARGLYTPCPRLWPRQWLTCPGLCPWPYLSPYLWGLPKQWHQSRVSLYSNLRPRAFPALHLPHDGAQRVRQWRGGKP